MSVDGDASHAYRGYRLQALYTLGRTLTDTNVTFQPEGKEDLAIYDGTSQLSEIVQVKAYADPLTLSHLEPGKKDGFFARLAREMPLPANVSIRLASYGPCGPELQQAFGLHAPKQQTVAQKIHKANSSISEETAKHILERMLLEEVQETTLKERVFARLGQLCTGIDPEKAFDLMIAWLYRAAEAKHRVTQSELVQQIGTIGQFLNNTATYLREWGTTIVPIGTDVVKHTSDDRLREEFYSGSLTSYMHIQAELDINRQDKLTAIEEKFAQAPVVVVHGASGQGKTTLAYRYLHEHFPVYYRYQVRRVENVAHALKIVTAITNHVHVLDLPIAFYLDVTPGDTAWTEVARQLVSEPNVRLLVTIREEDWRFASLPNEVFPHVFLGLTAEEARSIYDALTMRTPSPHFLTFEDAWAAFGEVGPLMEFIHLLTQGTTLRYRLTQQIQRLEDEVSKNQRDPTELAILRLVAVAAACNGRLQVEQLANYLQLRVPRRTLERLEQEYLLRTSADGSLVGGLHPLRSHIIAELLTDPALSPRFRSAQECLPLLYKADVQPFLLASWIHYPADNHILVQHLLSWQPVSWMATVGVVRALLWLGVAEYVEEDRDLIREVQRDDGMGLPFLLDLDIAGLLPRGTIGLWEELASTAGTVSEERRQAIMARQARQTDKNRCYLYIRSWLNKRTEAFLVPSSDADWLAVAEVVFWVGYLQILWPLAEWLPLSLLESAMPALHLETVADVTLGLFTGYGEPFVSWYTQYRDRLLLRFRQETLSIGLEDTGTRITAYYIVAPESLASTDLRERDSHNPVHNTAMQRIWLLRRLAPDREEYGCQGRGHHLGSLEMAADDAIKRAIPRHRLPPAWLVGQNALLQGIINHLFRPVTWEEYVGGVLAMRQHIVETLKQLVSNLETYFRRRQMTTVLEGNLHDTWKRCRQILSNPPLLPQCAVDPWGWVDEGTQLGGQILISNGGGMEQAAIHLNRRWFALQDYEPFLKAWKSYIHEMERFFDHGEYVLLVNPVIGKGIGSEARQRLRQHQAAEPETDHNERPRRSQWHLIEAVKQLTHLQVEFRRLFAKLTAGNVLPTLERAEQEMFNNLLGVWRWMAFTPQIVEPQPLQISRRQEGDRISKFQRRIQHDLAILTFPSLRPALRTGIFWENDPVLCVVLDAARAEEPYQALQPVLETLHRILHAINDQRLERYSITRHWASLIVVPLLSGKSTTSMTWRISMSVFLNLEAVEQLKWWNWVQHPLPEETCADLQLSRWSQPEMQVAANVMGAIQNLRLAVAHLHDVQHFGELDEAGEGITRNYLQEYQTLHSQSLQAAIDALTSITEIVKRYKSSPGADIQSLETILQGVRELYEDVLPTPDFSKEAEIPLAAMEPSWLGRLEQAANKALALYVLTVNAVMHQLVSSGEAGGQQVLHDRT